eukprot:TRINITY_DN953_c1_g1_i1.p1 TRINITY_DN953_c1_g1~~TRINITY_DN953_c1_g1_i1.p1  ORF type:complete len:166 (-),score=21.84 TRINITY_DN953_c1_g1_i1:808-1305(-)
MEMLSIWGKQWRCYSFWGSSGDCSAKGRGLSLRRMLFCGSWLSFPSPDAIGLCERGVEHVVARPFRRPGQGKAELPESFGLVAAVGICPPRDPLLLLLLLLVVRTVRYRLDGGHQRLHLVANGIAAVNGGRVAADLPFLLPALPAPLLPLQNVAAPPSGAAAPNG